MVRRLWRFHGGLHINAHKEMSMHGGLHTLAVPHQLVLPLQQHIGAAAEPAVKVGDKVLKGQMIARATDYVSVPLHAPTSGTIIAIEDRPVPHPSGMSSDCIVLESDTEDRWTELKPTENYKDLEPSALRNIIRDAGIVGLGGAGFPSFIKLNPGPDGKVETLILNGAECEPYITCDAMLMQEAPRRIIEGLLIMQHALRAAHCIIAVEDNKPDAIDALQDALEEIRQEDVYQTGADSIEIVTIPTLYPTGGEKQLIKVLTGKEIPSNSLPLNLGIVCHNIATAAAIADAVKLGKPLISRYVTVSGEMVNRPANLEVLIGTPFKALLEQCELIAAPNTEVLMGGPLMGFSVYNYDVPVIKTSNCLLAKTEQRQSFPTMPCIRCGDCARVCPAQLMPQQLYWYARAKNFDKIQDYNLFDCIECGCCAYVCPSHIPLVQYYRFAKTEIWAQEREKKKSDEARERHEFRLFRMERKKQEDEERKRKKKELLKKSQNSADSEQDNKKAAIEAAMARVKAKRNEQEENKKNVDGLTAQQKQAIAAIDERRKRLQESATETAPAKSSETTGRSSHEASPAKEDQ